MFVLREEYLKFFLCSIAFLPGLVFVLFQSEECMKKFMLNPQVVDVSYVEQTKAPFPVMTLCPMWYSEKPLANPPAYNYTFLQVCHVTEDYHFWMKPDPENEKCRSSNDPRPTLADFGIEYVILATFEKGRIFNGLEHVSWDEINLIHYGRCFTMSIKAELRSKGIWQLIMGQESGKTSLLTFHRKGAFKDPYNTIGGSTLLINAGQHTRHNFEYEWVRLIDYDGRKCTLDEEYDAYQCAIDQVDKSSLELYGCASPLGNHSQAKCANASMAQSAANLYFEEIFNLTDACPNHCSSLWTRSKAYAIDEDNQNGSITQTVIFFDKYIKVSQSRYSYGFIGLTAEVGSHVGLFLGLSLMNIPMVIFHLIQWMKTKMNP